MNLRISFVLVAAVAAAAALPPAAIAQDSFEGVIAVQTSAGPGGQQEMQYSFKGDKVRMDISAQGMQMYTLFDRATHTSDMVIPMRKMYMESTVNTPATADSAAAKTNIEWTGKKETIAGYECEHANITGADGSMTDACLAKGIGAFMPSQGGPGGPGGRRGRGRGMGAGAGWEGHIGATFPLKAVRNGEVMWLVTSVDKKSLDDSLFTVPAGYQKMGMPGGGRGRLGGRGGF